MTAPTSSAPHADGSGEPQDFPAATLHHAHIFCNDLDGMIDFWVRAFGAKFIKKRMFGDCEGAVLDMGSNTQLYLKTLTCACADTQPVRSGVDHLGVQVDSMETSLARVLALPGTAIVTPPFRSAHLLCAFVQGPEGVVVEIIQPVEAPHAGS